ncbi:MAG TPA: hypothetical protein VFG37_12660 [Planctomycetota bacterium]|jgi:hypothetical protein|nr:hypothetical protein [Planctomycetota bacterium]
MPRFVIGTVAFAAFFSAFAGAPPREDIAYVTPARAALVGMSGSSDAPLLAEVLSGCAVRVLERREGMVRVAVEGWVAEGTLAKDPPYPLPLPKEVPPAPPARPSNEPVADLALADHLQVEAALKRSGDALEYAVTVDLRTKEGRPVVVAGSKQKGRIKIYTQRRVGGEPVKGDVLLERELALEDGKALLEIPMKELSIPSGTRALFLSARAELSGSVVVHGGAADVAVAER